MIPGKLESPKDELGWARNTGYQCESVQSVGIYVPRISRIDTDTRNIYPWFSVVPCSSVVSTYPRKDASQREIIPTTDEHGFSLILIVGIVDKYIPSPLSNVLISLRSNDRVAYGEAE